MDARKADLPIGSSDDMKDFLLQNNCVNQSLLESDVITLA